MEEPIRYFLPGPTYVRRVVREAMLADIVGHRSRIQVLAELI